MKIEIYKKESECQCERNENGDIINCTCLLPFVAEGESNFFESGHNFVKSVELSKLDSEAYLKNQKRETPDAVYFDQENKRLYFC